MPLQECLQRLESSVTGGRAPRDCLRARSAEWNKRRALSGSGLRQLDRDATALAELLRELDAFAHGVTRRCARPATTNLRLEFLGILASQCYAPKGVRSYGHARLLLRQRLSNLLSDNSRVTVRTSQFLTSAFPSRSAVKAPWNASFKRRASHVASPTVTAFGQGPREGSLTSFGADG